MLLVSFLLGCSDRLAEEGPAEASPTADPVRAARAEAPESPGAQEAQEDSAPAPRPPALLFDETVLDFGEVLDVEDLRAAFSFMNVGDEPLVIGELDPSCGCTTLALERREYGPGEVGSIEVVWDTIGWGRQQKTIEVHSNAAGAPVTLLTIEATIRPFATTEPAVLDFGPSDNREERRMRFELRCEDPNFQISEVASPVPELELVVLEPPQAGRAVLEAIRRPTTRVGSFLPTLDVVLLGVPAGYAGNVRHTAQVKTRANLYRELLVEPPLVSVGRVLPGAEVELRVTLTRPAGGAFSVLGASLRGAGLEGLRVEPRPLEGGAGFTLVITGAAGAVEGPLRGSLVLETDLPGEPARTVPVMGMIAR